jgi:(1->4)-alpha-D-glucan 1-alpha-D-glucosylmutase
VDYDHRACLLAREPLPMGDLLRDWRDGAVKLRLTERILRFRAHDPDLFARGEYRPLSASGPKSDCICAFERHHDGHSVIVAVARFPVRRAADPDWAGTTLALPPHLDTPRLRDLITGDEIPIVEGQLEASAIFGDLPVAMLRPWAEPAL